MAGTTRTVKKQDSNRLSLMGAVRPELRFFVLAALITEGLLASVLPFVEHADRKYLAWGMLGELTLVTVVVAIIEIKRLQPSRADNSSIGFKETGAITKAVGNSRAQQPAIQKLDYHDVSIQVFLPDWDRDPRDEFYQDGRVQHQAFEQAREDSSHVVVKKLPLQYQRMAEGMSAEDLLRSMRKLYTENQATYFVMTMSSKVHCIFDAFGQWHAECRSAQKRLPVLISTVASAPGLANAQRGILRWYVRSQEESTLLAQYLRWEKKIKHAGVFFVTHRERQMNSHYGTWGKQIFKESYMHLKGETQDFAVTADNAEECVKMWLQRTRELPDRAAFVIGYGGMMKRTLDALISEQFAGPIACSSTLTRKDWQPKDKSRDANIVTVLPRLKGSQSQLDGDDRDVVFFFAKETLRRVIEMTSGDPDAETFLDRWKNGIFPVHSHLPQLCEEHLSNGDSSFSVEVVGSEVWRTQ